MFSKLVRLGKDAEIAMTAGGKQVCRINAAYNVGWGDNQKTVWINGLLWGDRGVKLAQYLTKGSQIVIHADDVAPHMFEGKNGPSLSLNMTIINVELVAKERAESPRQQPANRPAQQPEVDFDDDIPF